MVQQDVGRRRGWALDNEESELSGICVAAPIIGRDGRPVAAISVSSVAGRLPDDERDKVGDAAGALDDHFESWFLSYPRPPTTQPEGLESVVGLGLSQEWLPPPPRTPAKPLATEKQA